MHLSRYQTKQSVSANGNMDNGKDDPVRDTSLADNGGRRKSRDRRTFCYTMHIPERRSGTDRRAGEDRRGHDRLLGGE